MYLKGLGLDGVLLVFARVANHLKAFAENGEQGVWIPNVLNAEFEMEKKGENKEDDAAFSDAAFWGEDVPQTDDGIDETCLRGDVFGIKGVKRFNGSVATECANGKKVQKGCWVSAAHFHHGGANGCDTRRDALDAHVLKKGADDAGYEAVCFTGF